MLLVKTNRRMEVSLLSGDNRRRRNDSNSEAKDKKRKKESFIFIKNASSELR